MSRNYKIRDQSQLYFVSFAVVYWIDVFIRSIYRDLIVENLKYCQKEKGLEIYAWCIMSSHIHLIIGSNGMNKMQDILRDFKKYTSKRIIEEIKNNIQESRREWMLWMFERAGSKNANNRKYQFWQQHNQPVELSNNIIAQQKLDYLHMNPVVSGIVDNSEDYLHSSARDYTGRKGMIEVLFIE